MVAEISADDLDRTTWDVYRIMRPEGTKLRVQVRLASGVSWAQARHLVEVETHPQDFVIREASS